MAKSRAASRPLEGHLEAFAETGTEGIFWSFHEAGKRGYDGLHPLHQGDLLTIFNDAARQDVLWQGAVDFDHDILKKRITRYFKAQVIEGAGAVHGVQKGIDPKDWAAMFIAGKPATLVPKNPPNPSHGK